MATNILSVGNDAESSNDVTIAADSSLTVALKGAAPGASVTIELQDDDGEYQAVDSLDYPHARAKVLAAGTYRFTRSAGPACGVFSA